MTVFEGEGYRPTFPLGEEEAATSRETGCLQTTTQADTEPSHSEVLSNHSLLLGS